jgi:group I intron endonuclease
MNNKIPFITPNLVEDLSKTGIYCITQKSTGRRYIGSTSVGFYQRWKRHLKELKRLKHHSLFLQRAWDKYGSEDFVFEIIETHEILTDKNNQGLLDLEQHYLNTFKPEFNVSPSAHNRKGVKASKETRIKISSARKRQAKRPCSEETKKKISESNKGKHCASIETRRKMSDAKKGLSVRAINTYFLTPPNGATITVNNLKEFCKENNLNYQNLFAVVRGTRKTSQGWKIIKIDN